MYYVIQYINYVIEYVRNMYYVIQYVIRKQ